MKTYDVTGTRPVRGNQPGSEFQADLPPIQEAQLIRSGAISVKRATQAQAGKTRAELNELAREAGIERPETFRSKQEVLDALQGVQSASAADETTPVTGDTESGVPGSENPPAETAGEAKEE